MGYAMLRSLNVSLATALAFLGSLIEPAAAQQQVLTSLALHGIPVHPDFRFERVLDGFSAQLIGPRS